MNGKVINLCRKVGDGLYVNAAAQFPPELMRAWDELDAGLGETINVAGEAGVPPQMVIGLMDGYKTAGFQPGQADIEAQLPPVMRDGWEKCMTKLESTVSNARAAGLPGILIRGALCAFIQDILDMMMFGGELPE